MHIFIADIHLKPGNLKEEEAFIHWLSKYGSIAKKIYILGDLFDYWYTGIESKVKNVLKAVDKSNITIVHGNRDFLMRPSTVPQLEKSEEIILTLYGRKCLAAHGQTLTSRDTGFKILHAAIWPVFKFLDHKLDAGLKETIARKLVRVSSSIRPLSSNIRPEICVEKGVDMVICGHLHRGIMRKDLIVLPPFATERAWLAYDENGPVFCRMN